MKTKHLLPFVGLLLCSTLFCQTTNYTDAAPNVQVLELTNGADKNQVEAFLVNIKRFGFQIEKSVIKSSLGKIKKIELSILHPQGLNWSVNAKGFEHLELRIRLNESDLPEGISCRLNRKGKFHKYIELDQSAKSVYNYKPGYYSTSISICK